MKKLDSFSDQQENHPDFFQSFDNLNNNLPSPAEAEQIFSFMQDDDIRHQNHLKQNNLQLSLMNHQSQLHSESFLIKQQVSQKNNKKEKKILKQKKIEQKLKKNRQSAKMFREKKKQYINILEQKNLNFEKKILQLQTKLKTVQLQRDRLKNFDSRYIKSFKSKQTECLQKIQICCQNFQKEPEKLRQSLDQYNQKFGSTGTQRIDLLNYHMSEIIQNLMNDFQKYFINSFLYNRGMFGPNNRQIQIDLENVCKNPEGHMQRIQKKYGSRLQKHLSDFADLIQVFYRTNIKLRIKCQDIQSILRQMSGQHEDIRLGQMIMWFQKNKNLPQMNLKGQWYNAFKGNQEDTINDIRNLNKAY